MLEFLNCQLLLTEKHSNKHVQKVVEIAYEAQIAFYDALPVAIAEYKKIVCVTADEETQYKKLQPKGYPIELL